MQRVAVFEKCEPPNADKEGCGVQHLWGAGGGAQWVLSALCCSPGCSFVPSWFLCTACGILAQTGQGMRAVPPGWSRVTWGFLQKRRLLSCSEKPAADNGMSSQDLPFESDHRTGLGTGWEPHNWVPMVFYLCNSFCCFSTPCGSQVQLINGNELHALRNVANKWRFVEQVLRQTVMIFNSTRAV